MAADDGGAILDELADRLASGTTDRLRHTWSYHHRTDLVDIVVLDSRNARVLQPDRRSMLAPADWALLDRLVDGSAVDGSLADGSVGAGQGLDADGSGDDTGPADAGPGSGRHLLIVSSVPWAMPVGIHRLQEWVSHLADEGTTGRWSSPARWVGERLRRAIDLEHWPAFGSSYERLRETLARAGRRACPPPSTVVLSGDVHFAYVARVDLGPDAGSAHQVVASPLRQVELTHERGARRLVMSRFGRRLMNGVARRSAASTAPVSFDLLDGPVFDNNIATLTYGAGGVTVGLDRAVAVRHGSPELRPVAERSL
ncbi:MAG: hypothetical protein ACFCVK_23495 [Acidimicrobiales bacterium]